MLSDAENNFICFKEVILLYLKLIRAEFKKQSSETVSQTEKIIQNLYVLKIKRNLRSFFNKNMYPDFFLEYLILGCIFISFFYLPNRGATLIAGCSNFPESRQSSMTTKKGHQITEIAKLFVLLFNFISESFDSQTLIRSSWKYAKCKLLPILNVMRSVMLFTAKLCHIFHNLFPSPIINSLSSIGLAMFGCKIFFLVF